MELSFGDSPIPRMNENQSSGVTSFIVIIDSDEVAYDFGDQCNPNVLLTNQYLIVLFPYLMVLPLVSWLQHASKCGFY